MHERDELLPADSERSAWPVRRYEIGAEPSGDLSRTTSATERIAMMWPLALEAWALAGLDVPTASIRDMPSRIVRGAQQG